MGKKKFGILAIFVFAGLCSVPLSAGSQWDITLGIPYHMGVVFEGEATSAFSDYLIVLPEVKWGYYWGPEVFHVGVGFRLWTLLLESAVYPNISIESQLGNFVINANIGGWTFLVFGLYNDIGFSNFFLPDFSIAYRFGKKKIFSLGTGVMFFVAPDIVDNGYAFIGTAFARWSF